jgi:hypothetical protein
MGFKIAIKAPTVKSKKKIPKAITIHLVVLDIFQVSRWVRYTGVTKTLEFSISKMV